MFNFLKNLFWGCDHKWKIIQEVELRDSWAEGNKVCGAYRVLQCEKCGNLKNFKSRV